MNTIANPHIPTWYNYVTFTLLFGISSRTWYEWKQRGDVPYHEIDRSGQPRFRHKDVMRWLVNKRALNGSRYLTLADLEDPAVLARPVPANEWLTIPEVCAELDIDPFEWHQWRTAGNTPPETTGDDGADRVERIDLDIWLETLSHTDEGTTDDWRG